MRKIMKPIYTATSLVILFIGIGLTAISQLQLNNMMESNINSALFLSNATHTNQTIVISQNRYATFYTFATKSVAKE